MILTSAAIDNRTVVWVLVLLIIFLGTYAYVTLPRESFPDIPIPFVIITAAYEGVSPEDVESAVTLKLEKDLAGIKGVKEITSVSAEGMSTVLVEFLPDVQIEDALQYVRDKVDQVRGELPSDADEPTIKEISVTDFPILLINISGDLSPVRLKAIADELEDVIEELPGVLGCDVLGGLEREIRLEIDHDRFVTYGLTIAQLLALVPSEHLNVSAGSLETPGTKFNVRIPAEFSDPDEVEHLILAVYDGRPIYLSDIGTVRDTFKDRTTYSRLDGRESITLSVQKRVGTDIFPITLTVGQILEEARRRLPGVSFEVTLDQSKDIRSMVSDLENNIASGLILVIVVLFLFLGWRTSTIVAIAIPMSMLISFAVIQSLGYTLNMVVLFSLIMALGMLVDNAIVIVENIYRHLQLGYSRIEAAKIGTSEVAWPVITSTATTLAAFSPMLFWPDIMGEFMKYLPITLIITLSSSLFVALVINPTVCSVLSGGAPPKGEKLHPFLRAYRRLLAAALEYRFVTLTLAILMLAALAILYGKLGRGVVLFPEFDPRLAYISIRAPQGTSLEETDRLARIVEQRLESYRQHLKHYVTNVGAAGGGFSLGPSGAGPHLAGISLLFRDYEVRQKLSTELIRDLRQDLTDLVGAEIEIREEEEGPPTGAAVTVRISGRDFKILETLSSQAENAIKNVPGLVNLRSDHEAARPELAFRTDRQRAMLLGVNTSLASNFLKTAILGRKVGTYRQFRDEYDITIRLPQSQRVDIDDLLKLQIPNANGQPVPLSSLGEFVYTGGLGTIRHLNQRRVITLTGDAEGRLSTDVLGDVQQILAELDLPVGYDIRYAGEQEEQQKAQQFLTRAYIFALLLITMILVAQFNSLLVPFIIMTTVVLSLIGVLVGLIVFPIPFSVIMTGVGVISLAGVVVNNAIVLLYYTRQLQQRGLTLIEAAIEAGTVRLRPVLLSAVTTILGLMPMASGLSYDFHVMQWATRSESSQWWSSMAIAVIFGLGFATMLTLIVVPTLYVTLTRLFGRAEPA